MIALYDAVFGYIKVIVFHLMERIAINLKKLECMKQCKDRLGFSYPALKSRHEVPGMP